MEKNSSKKLNIILVIVAGILLLSLLALLAYRFMLVPNQKKDVPVSTSESRTIEKYQGGYFPTDSKGLFYPEQAVTHADLEELLRSLTGKHEPLARSAEGFTLEELSKALSLYFDSDKVSSAIQTIETDKEAHITRAELAMVLNAVFGVDESKATEVYFPDVSSDASYYQTVSAAVGTRTALKEGEVCEEGFLLGDNGTLYYIDETGYCLRNQWVESLYFGEDGAYTSGDEELDGYVRQAIAEILTPDMTREDALKAMYMYVRTSFSYLVRDYHLIGEQDIAMEAAKVMYSTGKGNCYNYASAFWAAARALGYNAKFVSGTVGIEMSPHGWVEIYDADGTRHTYDVELEMAFLRDGELKDDYSLFDQSDEERTWLGYVENVTFDNAVPRDTIGLRSTFTLPENVGKSKSARFIAALKVLGEQEPTFTLTSEQEEFIQQDETLWDMSVTRNTYYASPYRFDIDYNQSLWKIMTEQQEFPEPCWMTIRNVTVLDIYQVEFDEDLQFTILTCSDYNGQRVRLIVPGTTEKVQVGSYLQAFAMAIAMSNYTSVTGEQIDCLVMLACDLSL